MAVSRDPGSNRNETENSGSQSKQQDPTRLTVELLHTSLATLKEIFATRLDGMDRALELANRAIERTPTENDKSIEHLKALIGSRLDSMDVAVKLLKENNSTIPAMIDEKIESLKRVVDEKFGSIQLQFRERDVRADESSKDSKVAIEAALQAAKEAVGEQNKSSSLAIGKSEASVMKQIDQMGLLIATQEAGIDDKISDLKDRLTRIEGMDLGKGAANAVTATNTGQNMTILGLCIAGASVIVALAFHLIK